MAKKKKESPTEKFISLINILWILFGIVFVCVCTFFKYNAQTSYKSVVLIWFMSYVIFNDIFWPFVLGNLRERCNGRILGYALYVFLDILGFVMLVLFVTNADLIREPFHYAALGVFVILLLPKNLLLKYINNCPKKTDNTINRYNTINSEKIIKTRNTYTAKKTAAKSNIEPTLRQDRFKMMPLDDYVGGKSVDEMGNMPKK